MSKEKKINSIVVGSGFGGIASALRLRALGHKVTLCPRALNLRALAIPPKPDPTTIEFIFFCLLIYKYFKFRIKKKPVQMDWLL